MQWWIKKFCKGDKSLEGEECSDWSSEVDNDQLRGSLKVILHKKLPKNSTLTILWSFSIWSKLKRWKNSISGCLMSWRQIKKSSFLSVVFSFLCNENKPFLDPTVVCNKKWILYDNWQQSAQWWTKKKPPGKPQETPKHFPKPNSDQKKVMVTVCWSAKGIIHDSFLNPGKTITSEKYAQQIHGTHQKLLRLKPASVKRKGPIFLHNNTRPHSAQPTLQKLNKLGYKILPHPPYSWPLINWRPLLQASQQVFEGQMLPQPAGRRKCFPRVCQIPKKRLLCYKNKQTYFSLKKCVDCNSSYFD